jgi:hypothetical protein
VTVGDLRLASRETVDTYHRKWIFIRAARPVDSL